MSPTVEPRSLVLASGSRYRAAVLEGAGWSVLIDPPDIDERVHDGVLHTDGPEQLAVLLAEAKASAVAPRHPGAIVLAGDQVGVLDTDRGPVMLTKQAEVDGAVRQLMQVAGTTHRLINALVLIDTTTGRRASGVDVQRVTMRDFDEVDARAYVERFTPFDSAGSYRLEDGDAMSPLDPFVVRVEGEDPSGVLGLPLPLLDRLVAELMGDIVEHDS